MSHYLACYDIHDTGQRARVAQVLLDYGRRLQLSVFEIWLEPDELSEFRRRIGVLLAKTDRFDVIPIDSRRSAQRLSWQRPLAGPDVRLIGPFPDRQDLRPANELPIGPRRVEPGDLGLCP